MVEKQGEKLDELLGGFEERIARLERKDVDRELVVNLIKVIIDPFVILEIFSITKQDFCTFICGREEWSFASSTGLRVGFLQACAEDWT